MGNILDLMGINPTQRQRLATFNFKGPPSGIGCSSWQEERLTTIWGDFIRRFDLHFIFAAMRAGKEAELLVLEQGDMSVTAYKDKFISLSHLQTTYSRHRKGNKCFREDSDLNSRDL